MPANVTPMMQQYLTLKEKYSDCLLFFRLGDFYEMFFEDAITASRELEIVLTGRDCGLEERAPMCGVPYHSVSSYVNKLIDKGYKVAICEQLTDPADSKGLVERDVIRIITPGTIIEESFLAEGKNNYIAALYLDGAHAGLAYCDVSTGSFFMLEFAEENWMGQIADELARIMPTEIIANDALFLQEAFVAKLQATYYMQCYDNWAFAHDQAYTRILGHFKVSSLDGFGCEDMRCAVSAAGALIAYLEETQKNTLAHIRRIRPVRRSAYMQLDVSTRRNLELTQPIRTEGSKKNTLLYLLDKTCTSMGARQLRTWIDQPLQRPDDIALRLDAVEELFSQRIKAETLRDALDSVYDIERLCSRIAYGTVNPRDCDALRKSLAKLPAILEVLSTLKAEAFAQAGHAIDPMPDIAALLCDAIIDEPPVSAKEGGVIRDGYNEKVDEYRAASRNAKTWLAQMEAKERESTGIKNLRINFNKVFGYYIEVTKSYQNLVPYTYQRKQTLVGSERYITPELKELEETILGAEEKCIALEGTLFGELCQTLLDCIDRLQINARCIAALDVYQSLAAVAFNNNYCKPKICAKGKLEIVDGRHPVVEQGLKDGFIPNNTLLDEKENRLLILTGPNMAGKSTYMRQVALITLMAHVGSFVPARSARIPITDRIFTRVGASDNLASGQSTFMVEMSEMSNILNNATPESLLIIDEIGRGTSTFDGLSIAWAVLEHIADREKCGAKTLFATHYHELTELEGKLPGIKNYRISVKEVGEDIIFLRKIVRGGADKSFGVQVARLAGLPDGVIKRAKEILAELEKADINQDTLLLELPGTTHQMTLFGSTAPDEIMEELKKLDMDALTPREAQGILYDLHIRAKLR
ncbi:MAG: DNA mismatch repair protein MutS [Clostridia bacterium]|nr:DNA mismatch repair protein MutS [Clostridia bacterium]